MVEKNYTIPINEQFDKYDGCPVCRLHAELERQNLEYIMGAAMMEPDVRIESNAAGFCRKHYSDMLKMKNRLSLALMLESYLDELDRKFTSPKKVSRRDKGSASAEVVRAAKGCFVCERMSGTLQKYYSNIVYLWRTEAEFREKFSKQPFFCLEHTAGLYASAESTLPPKLLPEFAGALFEVSRRQLDVLRDEVGRFCKSFDYRYANEPLGNAAQGVEHAIEWILGEV